ncbi:MAG: glycine dehydrogenase (aminomethyl-transferring), partial [Actinobacteria bacterium]|nr:glycine dehydrogenase (aminomethyl-transferring) [Actinomycetota bacterium]
LGGDIAVGSAQRFGTPMGFGGPHAGFLAIRTGLERSLPGRLVGQSVDANGEPAYRLALQTREQHIRRDKATSNICTAQVLLAVISALYAIWHGPSGLKAIAARVHSLTANFAKILIENGYQIASDKFFDTLTITGFPKGKDANTLSQRAVSGGFNLRQNQQALGVSFDEFSDEAELAKLCEIFDLPKGTAVNRKIDIDSHLQRKTDFLQHPIFNTYHSETAMLRYMRNLADRDLALDRTMIPLGSCTMKLNSVTEMEAVTWPEFSSLHPFAPADQSKGTRELIKELSEWLVAITGYDAVSLQPNAGSQGEFAGLLAIRNYHDSRGDHGRTICLIPSSAH